MANKRKTFFHMRGKPKPFCACGCGERVKGWRNRYASPECVPSSLRADNCRRGRKTFAYRRRAILFRAELERLTGEGRKVNTEDLLTSFHSVYKRGYVNGYHASSWRAQKKATAA